jgi:hypothetical protein
MLGTTVVNRLKATVTATRLASSSAVASANETRVADSLRRQTLFLRYSLVLLGLALAVGLLAVLAGRWGGWAGIFRFLVSQSLAARLDFIRSCTMNKYCNTLLEILFTVHVVPLRMCIFSSEEERASRASKTKQRVAPAPSHGPQSPLHTAQLQLFTTVVEEPRLS